MTFIRAPYITDVKNDVEILAELNNKIIAVRYKNQLAMSFHPELDDDYQVHRSFLNMV